MAIKPSEPIKPIQLLIPVAISVELLERILLAQDRGEELYVTLGSLTDPELELLDSYPVDGRL